jgi:hypothetical protein
MVESQPWVGIIGALVFLSVGVLAICGPLRIQRTVLRSYEGKEWRKRVPFLALVESSTDMPSLRVLGWLCVGASAFLMALSVATLLQD